MENLPISIIGEHYVATLRLLNKKLADSNINWVIGGDLGEALLAVKVTPELVEIVTGKSDVEKIRQLVLEYNPETTNLRTRKLARSATIAGTSLPVYTRSNFSEFHVNSAKIEIHGGLQYKIDDWDWGDELEFTPEYVYVVGDRLKVIPLSIKRDIYKRLGWEDRVEKIDKVFARMKRPISGTSDGN